MRKIFIECVPRQKGNSKRTAKGTTAIWGPKGNKKAAEGVVLQLLAYRPNNPLPGCLLLDLTVWVRIPKSWKKSKRAAAALGLIPAEPSQGDRDQHHKQFADCLEKAGYFANDAAIMTGPLSRCFARDDERTGYEFLLYRVNGRPPFPVIEAPEVSWRR